MRLSQQSIRWPDWKESETKISRKDKTYKSNNSQSGYVLHILKHHHQYGTTEETMESLNPAKKSTL
jgi:hypothetical protein